MPYPRKDVGPDFDETETAKAQAYVTQAANRAKFEKEREKAMAGDKGLYEDLLHRMKPIMKSTPTYEEGGVQA